LDNLPIVQQCGRDAGAATYGLIAIYPYISAGEVCAVDFILTFLRMLECQRVGLGAAAGEPAYDAQSPFPPGSHGGL